MADTTKVLVTNKADGPRVFNSVIPCLLHPGHETGPVEISTTELASMQAAGCFEITEQPSKPAKA